MGELQPLRRGCPQADVGILGWRFCKSWKNHTLGSIAALGKNYHCQDAEALLGDAPRDRRKQEASGKQWAEIPSPPLATLESHPDPAGKAERIWSPSKKKCTEKGGLETER